MHDEQDKMVVREQAAEFGSALEGRKIIKAEEGPVGFYGDKGLLIYTDDGGVVELEDISDCCAYGEVESFLLNADKIDNVITKVTTNADVTEWYVLADMDEVMRISVDWDPSNGYYSFGLRINVRPPNGKTTP